MKKLTCLILATLITTLSLAGCTKPVAETTVQETTAAAVAEETAGQETTAGSTQSFEGVTLTVASSANWTKDIDKTLADKFTEETGIIIEFQLTPDDQYSNVLKAKFSTGEGPDVFLTASGAGMVEFLPEKNFLDLSNEAWVSRAEDWAIAGTKIDGKIIAMNLWSTDGWAMLYDPAKFEAAGITEAPKTYEELLVACDKLDKAGITPIYEFGNAVWHQPLWLNAVAGMAKNTNADYIAGLNNNELKFADVPEFELALQQQKELADKGYFGKDFMSATWETSQEAMASGKYAMMLTYSTYQNEVQAAYPESGADKWEMFPVPLAGNTMAAMSSGGIVHAINKNSKNIEAAKVYLNFLAESDNVKEFYAARPDLGATSFKDVPGVLTNGYATLMENSVGGTTSDMQTNIQFFDLTTIGKYVQEMYLGTKTPKEVLEAIDNDRQIMFDETVS